ncbi:MAG: cation:proton antiporter [Patescibacteria group bacterium]|nr:cation:proton antiporter [Patescibacteria group bacterium]
MQNIFFEITVVICLAAILSIVFRLLKQPLILAYILTGIIIGPFGQLQLVSNEVLQVMGEFGITLLLFILGLEIKLKDFQSIGKTILISGILQVFITQVIFYFTSIFFGFSQISSFYISIALTFSSTVIVVKFLSDKKESASLFGRISIGILLIQDLFAILLLILLSSLNIVGGSFNFSPFIVFLVLLKAIVLFSVIIFLSQKVFPKLFNNLAKSQEALFLISIAWVFGLAAFVSSPVVGFSVEIGGFLAGLALANAAENYQIASRLKGLRDFFITIFFVFLGMKMIFTDFTKILLPSVILAALVLILKPLVITTLVGLMGYRKRTSFFTGLTLAQVSEFSLIILFLGDKLGHIENSTVSFMTLVAIITFVFSTYLILNKNSLYKIFSPYLKFFEKKDAYRENIAVGLQGLEDHIILVGADGMGQSILDTIKTSKNKVMVVDFNPDIIKKLQEKNITSLFGDISDFDIQERLNLGQAKIIISTIPDSENNLLLVKKLNKLSRKTKIIVCAESIDEAKKLYKAGADYVVMPDLTGGKHVGKILTGNNLDRIEDFKTKDLASL